MKISDCSVIKTTDLDKLKKEASKYSEICTILHYGLKDRGKMTDEQKLRAIRNINSRKDKDIK